MKKYIQPTTHLIVINTEHQLLAGSNGVKSVNGLTGVHVSNDEFGGGAGDSRSTSWDDDDDF